jgi:hypothetical protein
MNEHDFSKKLVTLLDDDVNNISDKAATGLRAARHSAVAHAVSRQSGGIGRSGNLLHRHSWFSQHRTAVIGAVLIAVLLSVLGVWQMLPQPADNQAEIDAALLTDDLPVHAYLDNHFTQWLKNPSSAQ